MIPAPSGQPFDLSVKVTHWLRRTVSADTTNGDANVGNLSLVNGDVTDDNRVSLSDLGWVLLNFRNSDPMADLNTDGHVGFLDLAIVLMNFAIAGDP
jgi:hypothetical protein